MASSSSSSAIWKYDVFLSFRGQDTRKKIVSHLHKELVNKGIVTFKDDKRLEIGDSISEEISKAIQDSRFALVILSENYASSGWCLDELAMIMDVHLKKENKVIPIFYGVDPSHVRHQTGSFTLEKYHSSEMAQKVIEWREALTQIASITGKDSEVCEDEASMIEEVVEGISYQLFIMQAPVDFGDIVGIDVHMERLNRLLSIESEDEVRMIGIWGMGGIGKTTIAKCLFDRFSRGFPARCFLENVCNIYKKDGVSSLREKFLSTTLSLSDKNMKFLSAKLGSHDIKARLGHRKVFVVLDNVDDMQQVHALARESSWFGKGSRIIITTRDHGLLNSCGIRTVYEVKCLDNGADLKLFNQFAFEGGIPPSISYEKLSIQASLLAQGLPAAIEAYGLYLRRMKKLWEWKDALCRFEKAPQANVFEIFKISYDDLEEADKRVFLHVACLFNGEPLRRATTLLDDGELQGCLGVRILAEKALIKITAGGYINMHCLVEQTAKEIVRKESSHGLGGRRVLWDPSDIYNVLKRNGEDDPVECLALHMCEMPSTLKLKGYSHNYASSLKFLKVYKHVEQIESKLQICYDDTSLLSTRLRLLHWDAFPMTAFPYRFRPQSLVEISLRYSNLTSFGTMELFKLRKLDVSGSKTLELLPDLSEAVNLEELITQGCTRLKRIPESISNLTSLTKLDVSYCDELHSYDITITESTGRCRQIALYFSGEKVEMKSIANLSIGGNIKIRMSWLNGNADHLCLSTEQQSPDELTEDDQNKEMLCGLESSMRTKWGVTAMPEFHGNEPAFEFYTRTPQAVPELYGHESMKEAEQRYRSKSEFHGFDLIEIKRFNYNSDGASFLCHSLSMVPFLKELYLINLNIKVIPDDICDLQILEKLDWSGNDFESLPETMNQLPRLKYVSLCNCSRLQALPELVQLERIKLSGCTNLQSLFKISHGEHAWGRFRLLELWLDGCKIIQSISDQLGHFIKLSYLDLSKNDFETLPSSIACLSSLGTLFLNGCKKLKSIKGVPLCLKHLYAQGCDILETVSLPSNHSIKHLDLSHCFSLKQNEHLITQFLEEGLNEEDSPRFACFPGTEVPNYFDNIRPGSSYRIYLPYIWPLPKQMGFDGCVVIGCERPFHIQFLPLSYDWDWANERCFRLYLQPDFFHCPDSSFLGAEEKEETDHLVIIRGIKSIRKKIYEFGIETDQKIKFPSAKIKSTGFRMIWEHDPSDKIKTKKKKKPSQLSSLFKFGKSKNPSKFFD